MVIRSSASLAARFQERYLFKKSSVGTLLLFGSCLLFIVQICWGSLFLLVPLTSVPSLTLQFNVPSFLEKQTISMGIVRLPQLLAHHASMSLHVPYLRPPSCLFTAFSSVAPEAGL